VGCAQGVHVVDLAICGLATVISTSVPGSQPFGLIRFKFAQGNVELAFDLVGAVGARMQALKARNRFGNTVQFLRRPIARPVVLVEASVCHAGGNRFVRYPGIVSPGRIALPGRRIGFPGPARIRLRGSPVGLLSGPRRLSPPRIHRHDRARGSRRGRTGADAEPGHHNKQPAGPPEPLPPSCPLGCHATTQVLGVRRARRSISIN